MRLPLLPAKRSSSASSLPAEFEYVLSLRYSKKWVIVLFVMSLVTSIQLPAASARSLATLRAPGLLGEANTTIRLLLVNVSLCRGSSPGMKRSSLARLAAHGHPSSSCSLISFIDII